MQYSKLVSYLKDRLSMWVYHRWFYFILNKYASLLTLILGGIALSITFFIIGYFIAGYHYRSSEDTLNQTMEYLNLEWRNKSWEARLATLKREINVANNAIKDLKDFMYQNSLTIEDMKEQVYFYQSVIESEESNKGLGIYSVKSSNLIEDNEYVVEVVLKKVQQKNQFVKGNITIHIYGKDDNNKTISNVQKTKFSFKYFQRVKQVFNLKPGFKPKKIVINVIPKGHKFKALKEVYLWDDVF